MNSEALSKGQGVVIFLTGFSGAGKTTIAQALHRRLLESFGRPVTMLDGDVVRTHLSKGLGFSKEDRDANVRRIGFVAGEVAKHGGIAICAVIAPYKETRDKNRHHISQYGTYIEVFVNTSLEVCEARDVKGLYKKAREGLLKQFTGIDDVYEVPENPEIIIDGDATTADNAAERVVDFLIEKNLVAREKGN